MKKVIDRFSSLLFYSDLHGVRIVLSFSELLWAATLLWPGATFGRPTYTVMAQLADEEVWGLIFLFSGLTQSYVVYTGEYHSKFATYFAGWNVTLWLYVVISMYLSVSPPPAAISGEAGLVLAAAWVWIRTGYVCTGRRASDYSKDNRMKTRRYRETQIKAGTYVN